MKETLIELGEEKGSDELISRFIGPPLTDSFRDFLNYDEEKALLGAKIFKKNYQKKGITMACVYPYIEDTLKRLIDENKILAVATNKTHENALKILQLFQLDSYFEFIQGNVLGNKSDKAEIICKCIEKFKVRKEETILVGDAEQDESGAKKAGVDFIAVTYGFGFSQHVTEENIKCVNICNNAKEIAEFLCES